MLEKLVDDLLKEIKSDDDKSAKIKENVSKYTLKENIEHLIQANKEVILNKSLEGFINHTEDTESVAYRLGFIDALAANKDTLKAILDYSKN